MQNKFQKKAFTLIEMLIVIVIIGVLAAALIPRLTSVRDRANDVARRADLNQVATAIIAWSMDNAGDLPTATGAGVTDGGITAVPLEWTGIADALKAAGMDGIPQDPNVSNVFSGLDWDPVATEDERRGKYGYIKVFRNGVANKAFVLMTKTETPGASNRLWLDNTAIESGYIDNSVESASLVPCKKMVKTTSNSGSLVPGGTCEYSDLAQLRFIMVR